MHKKLRTAAYQAEHVAQFETSKSLISRCENKPVNGTLSYRPAIRFVCVAMVGNLEYGYSPTTFRQFCSRGTIIVLIDHVRMNVSHWISNSFGQLYRAILPTEQKIVRKSNQPSKLENSLNTFGKAIEVYSVNFD